MSFHVVLDGPPRSLFRVLGGVVLDVIAALVRLIGFVGVVLMLAGFTAFFWGGIIWLVAAREINLLSLPVVRYALLVTLAALAVGLIGIGLGGVLVRRRRKLVLFLRKFGHAAATEALTTAALKIGGRWRVVTLDDERIAAIGAPSTAQGMVNAMDGAVRLANKLGRAANKLWKAVLWAAGLGAAGVAGSILVKDGDPSERSDQLKQLLDLTSQPADAAAALFHLCAYLLLGCLAAAVVNFALYLVRPFLAFAPSLAFETLRGSINKSENDKLTKVGDTEAIRVARRTVRSQCRLVLGSRLMVLRVSTPIWQQTVSGFATMCTVALIDVTSPTENVVWEIREMLHRFGQRCIFVGQYDRILTLYSDAPPDSIASQVKILIQGHQILAYTSGDHNTRRFVKALRATLELRATHPRPP